MASKKKKLVQQARALGLDSVGTIYELEQRIAKAKEARTPKSEPDPDPISELDADPEPTPETKVDPPKPKPEPQPPRVHAVQNHDDLVTRTALKTTVKFIGRWYTLRKGKPLIAPKNVMDNLERGGFVEKVKR